MRVVIETRHGLLAGALADAGYTVLPVNPELVSRRRGPARKKDDAEDARICCLLALDRHAGLRRLIPHGQVAGELRSIARDDERACRDERRLPSRLRADLIVTFPAALAIAGDDLGATRILRLLERWPTAAALAAASREEIIEFGRAQRTGYLQRFADRIAGKIGEHIEQFTTPNSLQCYAGRAPVTRRSGKRDLVVAHRLACNRYLADAVHKWAFASLRRSAWAREFYDAQRARDKNHHAALRALGNRWLEVLWHCLTHGMPYDEAVHIANRNRALSPIAA